MVNKKIAVLIPDFEEGGMPRIASNVMKILHNDFRVDLILLNSDSELRFETYGANIYRIEPLGTGVFSKIKTFASRKKKLRELILKEKYNIIISFGVTANVLSIMCNDEVKTIITEHNIKSLEHKQWGVIGSFFNLMLRKYYPKATEIVAISKGMKSDLVKNYSIPSEKISVINNPYDLANIKTKGLEIPKVVMKKNNINFVSFGRFTKVKNQILLINLFCLLKEKYSNIRLFIFGEGIEEMKLKSRVTELSLEGVVKISPYEKNPYPIIKNADALLLPSINEGFPNIMIESLALGTPVIASDCISGPREILVPEEVEDYEEKITSFKIKNNGILTRRLHEGNNSLHLDDNEKDFYNAIVEFLEKDLKFDLSIESIMQYDLESIGKKYLELIDKC